MIVVNRAISLTQPWATLMAIGAKRIETRSWATKYRGWVAIHAAKAFPPECRALVNGGAFAYALDHAGIDRNELPLGAVIAVTSIIACRRAEDLVRTIGVREKVFGDYSWGRWGFVTDVTFLLREPILMKGALGIWRLPRPITEEDFA